MLITLGSGGCPLPRPGLRRRGGTMTALLLVAMPVLLALLFLTVDTAFLAEVRATLHNTTDAAALAAVQTLVDERWLTNDPSLQLGLIDSARGQAAAYAQLNPILGQPLVLRLPAQTTDNPPHGDIVFINLSTPRNKAPTVLDLNNPNAVSLVNAVRITAHRTQARNSAIPVLGNQFLSVVSHDLRMKATATLDRYVVGLRPVDAVQPIALVPLALFSDPIQRAAPTSWERQVTPPFVDQYAFAPGQSPPFVNGQADQLPEVTFVLEPDNLATARLLLLGMTAADLTDPTKQQDLARQIQTGVLQGDLAALGNQFVMGLDPSQSSSPYFLANPSGTGSTGLYANVQTWLQSIQGQPRVWPLFSNLDATTGTATITGLVAARLVSANIDGTGRLLITLQPTLLSTRTAVTLSQPAGQVFGGINLVNPYLCKVRLVE